MNLIQFIFALVRVYLPIPAEFKTDVENTYAEANQWWMTLSPENPVKKFFSSWWARTLLLFLILPFGKAIKKMGAEEQQEDKDLKELLRQITAEK